MDDYASPKRTLAERGLRPRKRFGQNFLVDQRFARRIAGEIAAGSSVLEIGGGTGALTAALTHSARSIDVIEIDRGLVEVLATRFARVTSEGLGRVNSTAPTAPCVVNIISGDALELDLRALLEARPRPRAICGNLPYSITTPLIERIVACADAWDEAVLMVQREYARRLTAKPATADYSSLTLFVSYYCDIEHLFDVGASGFYPAPAIASTVVRLRPVVSGRMSSTAQSQSDDPALLLWLIRAAFAQRRKTLVNSIAAQVPKDERPRIEAAALTAGLAPNIRGERLSLPDYVRLADALRAQGFRAPVR
jgi:16S rRNA (adenine1518-N6/adenine1519-N6)-dimethyltransferase